ncbi:MAG: hypothetical protein AB3N23_19960 [Paracoccaceae bacterium]
MSMSENMTNLSYRRRLPPFPQSEAERENTGEGFDIYRALRGWSAPTTSRFRSRTAWRTARAALKQTQWVDADDAALDAAWVEATRAARAQVRSGVRAPGARHRVAARRLALLRELTRRVTGLLPHPVQLVATAALSERTGVEMATGEGKTLVTVMAAALQAAEGWPVHVITANDYLALRDLEKGTALFDRLGLTSAGIDPDAMPPERAALYAADIVYASSKEIAFDHLRDRIAFGQTSGLGLRLADMLGAGQKPVMRGLWSAIVDEADSVMIDEARTPLVISTPGSATAEGDVADIAHQAVMLAQTLVPGRDLILAPGTEQPVSLTDAGLSAVLDSAAEMPGVWQGQRRARELAERACFALHMLTRDKDYILTPEDKVEIVDENTGRIMPDRTWSDGLHQMVEVKEGLDPSEDRKIIGRLTFQRFFRRYRRLSGLSGTLHEARRELKETYDLTIMQVPTHRPPQRRQGPSQILPTKDAKWQALAEAAAAHHMAGRPVLVGTSSVSAAEAASDALTAAGIDHRVLSARQSEDEARVIETAGISGTVTVATNMAGRGADIVLDDAAREAGGLVVLLAQRHDAARIDRQLIGRAARQGDPGLYEVILSAEDEILGKSPPANPTLASFDAAQAKLEHMHARQRAELAQMEDGLDDMTAFTGGLE